MVVGTSDQQADRCATCRGHGWLYVRSRPAYGLDAPIPATPLPRETCWDCGGKGWLRQVSAA